MTMTLDPSWLPRSPRCCSPLAAPLAGLEDAAEHRRSSWSASTTASATAATTSRSSTSSRRRRTRPTSCARPLVYRRDADDKLMILFTKPKGEAGKGYLRLDKNLW